MTKRSFLVLLFASALGAARAAPASAATCASMGSLSLPHVTITSAAEVGTGSFTIPADWPQAIGRGRGANNSLTVPPFCRITAVSRPTSDSEIGIEVWLPLANWNAKFQPAGNATWGGSINYPFLAEMVRGGFASASTDTGHKDIPATAQFALGHPEKYTDYGYRSFHEMTVVAQAAIDRFYEKKPALSYVDQCGGASRSILSEMSRYPESYDAAAALGIDPETTRHFLGQQWTWLATHQKPESDLPLAKRQILHKAALAACDAVDGLKDGLIMAPHKCKVDPAVVQCKGADGPDCLTPAQVEAARKIYSPVTNPRTKQVLWAPLLPGGELYWERQIGPEPFGFGTEFFRYLVKKDPTWDPLKNPVDFDHDAAAADAPDLQAINVTPNLNRFFDRGGKLMIIGGWADTSIAPASNTNFYERVVRNAGMARSEKGVRLFMIPGMNHCPNTPNTPGYNVDSAGIIEQWVRGGKAPDSIVVTLKNDEVDRKLLVCRYPQVATYKGTGDINSPGSFTCK